MFISETMKLIVSRETTEESRPLYDMTYEPARPAVYAVRC